MRGVFAKLIVIINSIANGYRLGKQGKGKVCDGE
jgi:hypothetical protein